MNRVKIIFIGYLAITIVSFVVLPILAQGPWPRSPLCGENEMIYNNAFTNGLLGWSCDYPLTGLEIGGPHTCPWVVDTAPFTLRLLNGDTIIQSLELPEGEYTFSMGMILKENSSTRPGQFPDILWGGGGLGGCEAIDPGEWQGEHWGQIRLFWKNQIIHTEDIPNGLPHDTYYQLEYEWGPGDGFSSGTSDFKIQLWSPAWCSISHNNATRIDFDWVSLCMAPLDTPTPTVTGTPPDTPTLTPTKTPYCADSDYPTATSYPTSTPYPTATDWLTPPILFTPTPYPTLTPYETCVPTWTPTPVAALTPFRFNVPLTYTNSFSDAQGGIQDFVDSTTGLLDDVSGTLITASNAVSNVTNFAITTTVNISGTPTAKSDLVTTFTSNMSGLSHLLGWFNWLATWKPTVYWFLLASLAWTLFVIALKFALSFFLNVIWPLAQQIWQIIVDLWNSIPFIG